MYGKMYEDDKVHSHPTDYIYCSVCDSLVFIPGTVYSARLYHDGHLERCISGNTILNEHARRKEILKSIDKREFRSGNINNTYYNKKLKLIVFV